MKLLVTGATGLIGSHFSKLCKEKGYVINYLTTSKDKIEDKPQYKGFYWDPEKGEIDPKCIEGVDKIIHFAGASVAQRWTKKHRKEILSSRIKTATLLRSLLSKKENQITQFISASAIGIYPSSLSKLYDESSEEKADDFLGLVVQEWEHEADEFRKLGVGVSKLRIGLVLSADSGFFAEIKKPIKYYVGSALGSGNQWQSWIHIDDLAALFLFVAEEELEGVFNAVAPNPVKQKYLINCIAKALKKPIFLPPVPGVLLKTVLGDMASVITSSQLVVSKRWEKEGFVFKHTQVQGAIRDLVE
ncbi:MAG TPA: TIGR01777 family oxidoreductase [Flavobacteriaceae bacterium]|nr:TIGR01777 family oxidoreductase [Flavobacteriaceae bacterium]